MVNMIRKKMSILLVNIDSMKIPNLALKKIERYYLNKGNDVFWSINHEVDFQAEYADKIFVSCIFSETERSVENGNY